eukprot:scaffold87430_cov63-Phaeocystis_antarctica.AAC.1
MLAAPASNRAAKDSDRGRSPTSPQASERARNFVARRDCGVELRRVQLGLPRRSGLRRGRKHRARAVARRQASLQRAQVAAGKEGAFLVSRPRCALVGCERPVAFAGARKAHELRIALAFRGLAVA